MPMHTAMAAGRGAPGKPSSRAVFALVGRVASGQETTADLKAQLREYRGKSRIAKALRTLPEGWHLFSEVGLVDGSIDYVVAGPRGVFAIEVKPALSIVGTDLTGHEVDGLPVFLLDELAGFLLNDDGRRLTWEEAKRVLDTLGAMTR